MEQDLRITIAKDFYAYPVGRTDKDGRYNGERFRREFLLPKVHEALDSSKELVVSLSGMKSFGSSFLDEAFAGIVRHENIAKDDLLRVLRIDPGSPSNDRYVRAIRRYIESAKSQESKS